MNAENEVYFLLNRQDGLDEEDRTYTTFAEAMTELTLLIAIHPDWVVTLCRLSADGDVPLVRYDRAGVWA